MEEDKKSRVIKWVWRIREDGTLERTAVEHGKPAAQAIGGAGGIPSEEKFGTIGGK